MKLSLLLLSFLHITFTANAQIADKSEWQNEFSAIYEQQLGSLNPCSEPIPNGFKVCSSVLKNDGNAPYILHAKAPKAMAVLFHGLSDSPFFLMSIAKHLQQNNITVVVPLTPGHGKKDADFDMEDPDLQLRWYAHVDEVMTWAHQAALPTFIGGFSTGGALGVNYALQHPEKIQGVMLFSGALQLPDNAESIAKIWGARWVAKIIDGEYATQGPNPYKYPGVALYSAFVLMDVINDIRAKLGEMEDSESVPNIPIFAAHSQADKTTPIKGVEDLMSRIDAQHSMFMIDASYDVCHPDLPIDSVQIVAMKFDKKQVKEHEQCAVPKANPVHHNMLKMMSYFLEKNI